ncbi:MAG: hypothetical protein ABR601_10850, partial [Parasphingopyxis sp.]|nr:hypothetical protein [Sphingomonadales bacterium]
MRTSPDLPRQSELLLWLVAGLVVLALAGMIAWQTFAFGWHPAREEPPLFDTFHWLRMWTTFGLGALVVATLVAAGRESPESAVPLSPPATGLGWLVVAGATAATGLFLASPELFHQLTVEDGAIEWSSALLLFIACGLMLASFGRQLRRPDTPERWRRLRLAATLGLAAIFFLMAMEEISWFQRVIGFDTPEPMAERNWQGEFNFHNFQTDLTELGLYAGTGLFLLLLSLMRETVGGWRPIAPVHALLPDRAAAAASAPMLLFTYGHW